MALDGAFLSIVRRELTAMCGCRVDKVHQPSRDEIVLSMRGVRGVNKILFSANAASPRVHLTAQSPENPKTPPMFCMLLRKHLGGGRLAAVRQDGLERIIMCDFDCTNELGDPVTITLIAEIMGKSSNIILTDGDGKIIDCIRRVADSGSGEGLFGNIIAGEKNDKLNAALRQTRVLLPAKSYTPPPRPDRISLLGLTTENFENVRLYGSPVKALISAVEGISPLFAREIIYRACGDVSAPFENIRRDRLFAELISAAKKLASPENTGVYLLSEKGVVKDFCFAEIRQYGGLYECEEIDGACALLDRFYGEKSRRERVRGRSDGLIKTLDTLTKRLTNKLALQREELAATADRDRLRRYGDILSANLYGIKEACPASVVLHDWETDLDVEIPLDTRYSPTENLRRFYAAYKKMVSAEKKLTELISEGEQDLIYLGSVRDAVMRTTGEEELSEIRAELSASGFYAAKSVKNNVRKNSRKPEKQLPFLTFKSSDGFTIYAGRGNLQNDRLTLKTAGANDMWFHTKDIAGSHVVVVTGDKAEVEIPERTLAEAAVIAAYCSNARESGNVPVDYTRVKYVKKPAGAKPGMVIFTHNKTLYVTPDENLYRKLLCS